MALYFRDRQPSIWQQAAVNLVGGLIGDMIKRDREYKQNKRYNEAINNAIAGAGSNGRAYMDSVSAMPEGYNDGGWEQAFHKNYTPMTEYNIGTADLMPKLPQQPPSGWDMRQSMATQLAGTGISPETIEKLYSPYVQNAEHEYQQWRKNKAAEDFANAVALDNQRQPQQIQPPLMNLPQEQPVQQPVEQPTENLYKANLYPRYESIIQKAAQPYGIDPELIEAMIKIESAGKPNAVSSAGAQGLMQLMPKTAAWLGVNNAFDPSENIMGGSKYVANLKKQYNGDVEKALWGYNAGPGNVAKGRKPKETQNYISAVMNEYNRLKGLRKAQPTTTTQTAISTQTAPQGYTDWSQFNNNQSYPSALLEAQKGVISGTMPDSILNSLRDYNTHNSLSAFQQASLYDADKQREWDMHKFKHLSAAQREEARLKDWELNQKQSQFDSTQAFQRSEAQRLQGNWERTFEATQQKNAQEYELNKEKNEIERIKNINSARLVDAQINELNKKDLKAGVEGYTKAIEAVNNEISELENIIEDRKTSAVEKERATQQRAALIEAKNKYIEGMNNFMLSKRQTNSTAGIATFPKEQPSQTNTAPSGSTVSGDVPLAPVSGDVTPTSPDVQPASPVLADMQTTAPTSADVPLVPTSPNAQPTAQPVQPSNNTQQPVSQYNRPASRGRVVFRASRPIEGWPSEITQQTINELYERIKKYGDVKITIDGVERFIPPSTTRSEFRKLLEKVGYEYIPVEFPINTPPEVGMITNSPFSSYYGVGENFLGF